MQVNNALGASLTRFLRVPSVNRLFAAATGVIDATFLNCRPVIFIVDQTHGDLWTLNRDGDGGRGSKQRVDIGTGIVGWVAQRPHNRAGVNIVDTVSDSRYDPLSDLAVVVRVTLCMVCVAHRGEPGVVWLLGCAVLSCCSIPLFWCSPLSPPPLPFPPDPLQSALRPSTTLTPANRTAGASASPRKTKQGAHSSVSCLCVPCFDPAASRSTLSSSSLVGSRAALGSPSHVQSPRRSPSASSLRGGEGGSTAGAGAGAGAGAAGGGGGGASKDSPRDRSRGRSIVAVIQVARAGEPFSEIERATLTSVGMHVGMTVQRLVREAVRRSARKEARHSLGLAKAEYSKSMARVAELTVVKEAREKELALVLQDNQVRSVLPCHSATPWLWFRLWLWLWL